MKTKTYKHLLPKKSEICLHYGQIYANVKNIKGFINMLTKKYIKDNLIWKNIIKYYIKIIWIPII